VNKDRSYNRLDDVPEPIGDTQFSRLDMRTDPAALAPGTVQRSENFRFDTTGARVRGGIARQLAAGDTVDPILYASVYRPDGDNDRIVMITSTALKLFDPDDQTIVTHSFPGGEDIDDGVDSVDFIQAGVSGGSTRYGYILRGQSKDVLQFDGTGVTTLPTFERGDFGLFYQDRIAVNDTAQSIKVSDFLDYTVWTLLNQFQILKGGDDYLVGLLEYQKDIVILATRKRFFIAYFAPSIGASGYTGTLNLRDSFLRNLTREGGLVGRRAWLEAGGLLWIVSDNGIYAFQPQLDLELTVLGEPISAPIQPIIDRLSANYASGACLARSGHRIYFALPISEEPLALASVSVNETPSPNEATFTTSAAHNLAVGDTIQISHAQEKLLNGVKTVYAAPTATTFTVQTTATSAAVLGVRATVQKIATRNNRIAVFNLQLNAWESIDTLPAGLFADFLLVSDHGPRRRLWIVDKQSGPALYEEGDVDEFGEGSGYITLPFTLPVSFSAANFEAAPIIGRLKSRSLRWGAFPRHVRAGEVRLATAAGDAGTINYTVRTPDRGTWTATRTFDDSNVDTSARKRCGKRGLEAEIEIVTSAGRPTVRTMAVEITASGKVAEE